MCFEADILPPQASVKGKTHLVFCRTVSEKQMFAAMALCMALVIAPAYSAAQEAVTAVAGREAEKAPGSAERAKAESELSEAEVMTFARQHHAELAELLEQLRNAESPEFERALRQLSTRIVRLQRIQERTPKRYDHELRIWKNQSQTQLLVARWVMMFDPELERQIRELMRQRIEMGQEQLRLEKQELQERLKNVEEQLAKDSRQTDRLVDREWQKFSRQAVALRKSDAKVKVSEKSSGKTEKGK